MRRDSIVPGGIIAALMAVTAAGAGGPRRPEAPPMTVADFAAVLANHGNTGAVETPGAATERLSRLGVPLGDPAAVLTEGRLATILGFYGIPAATSTPLARVEAERGRAAASILLATAPHLTGTKGRTTSNPAGDLGACLGERNRGQCVNCCKDMGSTASACAHFCQQIEPASPSAPR